MGQNFICEIVGMLQQTKYMKNKVKVLKHCLSNISQKYSVFVNCQLKKILKKSYNYRESIVFTALNLNIR